MQEILASYSILPDIDCLDDDETGCRTFSRIDALLKETLVKPPRRLGHMTKFACAGAVNCLKGSQQQTIPGEALDVFFGTGLGNMQESNLVQRQIFTEPDEMPSPIKFSTSLSNISAFFVAATSGAKGANQVISQNEFSFEGALLSSLLFDNTDRTSYSLVGAADCCFGSRQLHGQYMDFPYETDFGEGTGWLLLGKETDDSLGQILDVRFVPFGSKKKLAEITNIVKSFRKGDEPVVILPGLRIDDQLLNRISTVLPQISIIPYLNKTGIYPTAAAAGIADLIAQPHSPGLYLHLAQNIRKKTAVTVFRLNSRT